MKYGFEFILDIIISRGFIVVAAAIDGITAAGRLI